MRFSWLIDQLNELQTLAHQRLALYQDTKSYLRSESGDL